MPTEHILTGLAFVVVLGIASEWIAWRTRLPSIFVLLICGVAVGPVLRVVDPDTLLGPILMPIVSLSVAVILFEGGQSLKLKELHPYHRVVWALVTIGAAVTWLLSAVFARVLLGFETRQAILMGAILIVTGPTVVIPLLAHIRPRGQVASILKWEGIVIDPIGACFAVLVFESITSGSIRMVPSHVLVGALKTAVIGLVFGGIGAFALLALLKKHWIPDALHSPVALASAIGAFALSNTLQHESGLLSVTVMGVVLANQQTVDLRHVVEFKENLRVLLLSSLFIVLSARLDPSVLQDLGVGSILFLLVLILVVRPASVFVSTLRSGLSWRERLFIGYLAPRGVVAAAITAVFAIRLQEHGFEQARLMVPVTFLVITGTVIIYTVTSRPVARTLGLSQPRRNGVLIAGAHRIARELALALKAESIPVLLIDRNWRNISAARMAGLESIRGDLLSNDIHDDLDVSALSDLFAMTANDEVNSLAALHFSEEFGRQHVFQLSPASLSSKGADGAPAMHLRGRILFDAEVTYDRLEDHLDEGAAFKTTKLSEKFTYDSFLAEHADGVVPLLLIKEDGTVLPRAEGVAWNPSPGHRILALVPS